MLADKDLTGTIAEFAFSFDRVICTSPVSPRGLSAEQLAEIFEDQGVEVMAVESNPQEAYLLASRLASEENAALFVTGSLYLIGDVLSFIQADKELEDEE
jgi:folylpolyglutamate synthase/dihydropteroate synthase